MKDIFLVLQPLEYTLLAIKNIPKHSSILGFYAYKWFAAGKFENLKEDLVIVISTPRNTNEKIDFSAEPSTEYSNGDYPLNSGNN